MICDSGRDQTEKSTVNESHDSADRRCRDWRAGRGV